MLLKKILNKKIFKDFHLFIIYNPDVKTEKKNIQMLLDKCIIFSLPEFEANQKFSTDMLNEILTNKKCPKSLAINLSLRFSLIHDIAKKKFIIINFLQIIYLLLVEV